MQNHKVLALCRQTLLAMLLAGSAGSAAAVSCADEILRHLQNDGVFFSDAAAFFTSSSLVNMSPAELNRRLTQADEYALYTSKEDLAGLKNLAARGKAGIGMDIIRDRQNRVRCFPFPNSPADRAGIAYAQVLTAVDGRKLDSLELTDIAQLIRGKEGSEIELTVENAAGRQTKVYATRRSASYPSVQVTGSNPTVIRIFRFGSDTAQQLRQALTQHQAGSRRLFVDLRGNTGGLLEAGAQCAAFFLKQGDPIYHLRTSGGDQKITATSDGFMSGQKVMLMQDEFTASAAEIMIDALRSAGAGESYGRVSAGKGCMQGVYRLSDGGALKLTEALLLSVKSGQTWDRYGITPDVQSSTTAFY